MKGTQMGLISIIIAAIMGLFFLIALFLNFPFLFISFGVFALWAYRFYKLSKPDYIKAFEIGFKAAFFAYMVFFLLVFLLFKTLCACPILHIMGFIIFPTMSGIGAAMTNIVPEFDRNGFKK